VDVVNVLGYVLEMKVEELGYETLNKAFDLAKLRIDGESRN
jgi:hypothetical protein